MEIVDKNGNIIKGLVKNNNGSLVVNDITEYNKYIYQKKISDKLIELDNRISVVETLISKLIEKCNGN